MKTDEIRQSYLEFFKKRDHVHFTSDGLVPSNDPTLLFTSAGMVQFKAHFMGQNTDGVTRAVSCQKCFRTTDIEQVGYTARHHTFFEMLGNFSFGDYFKVESIQWAWEYVTQVLKLEPERLYPTVYLEDDEAFGIWENEIGVPAERIKRLGKKDNFWGPVGDSGPCGPCSELLYDKGEQIADEEDRFCEVWNLVFTQFNAQPDGTLEPLANKNIDTGAGLERLAAVLQNKDTNYEVDHIWPLIECGQALSGKQYHDSSANATSLRVLADHGRASTFAICDGITPANEGRGYVLRRIMRRAMMHARKLGLEGLFFEQLADTTRQLMSHCYPEINERFDYCVQVMQAEEKLFGSNLDRNLEKLESKIQSLKTDGAEMLSGEDLFYFHDTLGFPADMAVDIAIEHGIKPDMAGYEKCMTEQRERARASARFTAGFGTGVEEELKVDATTFRGYEVMGDSATVLAIIADGKPVQQIERGVEADIILDRTPFYAESGGQVGDTGVLLSDVGDREMFHVRETIKTPGGIYLHRGKSYTGIDVGDTVQAQVEEDLRERTMCNHTATHLLQAALRKVVGDTAQQSGSQVDPDGLRFDYTHMEALTPNEIQEIEDLMNGWVWQNLPVHASEMSLDEAKEKGAMALFGEKYGETVRVIEIGRSEDNPVSRELCGGTHIGNTGNIGLVKIVGESAISAGNRRITARTREAAFKYLALQAQNLQDTAEVLRCKPEEVPARVESQQQRVKELQKDVERARQAKSTTSADSLLQQARQINDVPVLAARVDAGSSKDVLSLMDQLRDKQPSGVIVLGADVGGKLFFAANVTDDCITRGLHAGNLVRVVAQTAGGKGGGKADRAQAGARDVDKLDDAVGAVESTVQEQLS